MATMLVDNREEIIRRAIEQLQSYTKITQLSPGSKALSIIQALATEVVTLEESALASTMLSFVGSAEGYYLDFIGDIFGVSRQQETPAEAHAYMGIMKVSAPSGLTFGDLNNGQDIRIPANTELYSSDRRFSFVTIGTTTLRSAESSSALSIRALTPGSLGNAPVGSITEASVIQYATSSTTPLVFYNEAAITSGTDYEDDPFYRGRVIAGISSIEAANNTAIRLAILSIPSVSDITILNLYRGVGTADVIIDSETGTVSDLMLAEVQRAIDNKTALGVHILARAPRLVGLEFSVTVKTRAGTTAAQKTEIINNIRDIIDGIVARTKLGQSLSINSIAVAILSSSPYIIDIGNPNSPLDEVILWRESAIFGASPIRITDTDYSLRLDERLTLKGTLSESVKVVFAW